MPANKLVFLLDADNYVWGIVITNADDKTLQKANDESFTEINIGKEVAEIFCEKIANAGFTAERKFHHILTHVIRLSKNNRDQIIKELSTN